MKRLLFGLTPALLTACALEESDLRAPMAETAAEAAAAAEAEAEARISGRLVAEAGADYRILVTEAATGAAWLVEVDAEGAFSVTVPSGTYAIALLDAGLRPIALHEDADGETIRDLAGEVALGDLTLHAGSHTLSSAAGGNSSSQRGGKKDLSDLAGVQTGKHAGGGNGVDVADLEGDGEGDADGDGVPDLLDNDSNENGIYDTAEGRTLCEPRVVSRGDVPGHTVPESAWKALDEVQCAFFDNLKLTAMAAPSGSGGDGDARPHTEAHVLAAHLIAPPSLQAHIARVEVTALPAYADAEVSRAAGGWTFTDYPTPGSAWADSGHALPLASDPMGNALYGLWIDTDAEIDPHPAVYQLRMTLHDGSTILYTTRLFFVFHTPPHLLALEDGAGTVPLTYPLAEGDPGSPGAPLILDGSGGYTLYASRPLDGAGGAEICGMSVSAEIFYEDADGRQLNTSVVQTPRVVDSGRCDPSEALSVDLDATDLPREHGGTAIDAYRLALMVSGPAGDNAATNLWARY